MPRLRINVELSSRFHFGIVEEGKTRKVYFSNVAEGIPTGATHVQDLEMADTYCALMHAKELMGKHSCTNYVYVYIGERDAKK